MIIIIHFTFVTNIIYSTFAMCQALCWTSQNSPKFPNVLGWGANSLWLARLSTIWFLLTPWPHCSHCSPALVFQPQRFKHEKQAPILGPFHLLFPVPGMPFVQCSMICHLIHWGPGSNAVVFRKPFLTTSSKIAIPVTPHTLTQLRFSRQHVSPDAMFYVHIACLLY